MLEKFKSFVKEAGQYSLSALNQKHQIEYKEGNDAVLSIVTDVDLHNSALFREFAEKNFADLQYVIIDEESINDHGDKLFEHVKNSEYQFILDPIDGTLNYSSGLPFYGLLAAVFKNGKPLYGFIYAPALDELVYSDGQKVYREHFGKTEEVVPLFKSKSRVVQAHVWEVLLKPDHIHGKYIVQDYFAAAIYSLYLSLGQLKAVLATAKIWDIAPLMVIGKALGFGLYNYDDKHQITFSEQDITPKGKIKGMMIMGFADELDEVKNLFADIIEV